MNPCIVLVEPGESRNIGAIARLASNFGVVSLRIVSPRNFNLERAEATACHGLSVLREAQFFPSLESAIADCHHVTGFSAVQGKSRLTHISLPQWIDTLSNSSLHRKQQRALVFGPEDTGLRYEHIEQCSLLVYIPTPGHNSSLNIAHAVAVVLYSYSCAQVPSAQDKQAREEQLDEVERELATTVNYRQAESFVDEIAYRIGFYHEGTSHKIPLLLKQILRRQALSQREMAIILGLLNKTLKVLTAEHPHATFPPEVTLPGTLGEERRAIRGSVPDGSEPEDS